MWTMSAALAFLRELEYALQPVGWHVALAGSVLTQGYSEHDLDVVVFPHCIPTADRDALHRALTNLHLRRTHSGDEMQAHWASKGSQDDKLVEVWRTASDLRIDFIIMPFRVPGVATQGHQI